MFPKNQDHLAGECVEIACQASRQTVVGTTVLVGPGIARPGDIFNNSSCTEFVNVFVHHVLQTLSVVSVSKHGICSNSAVLGQQWCPSVLLVSDRKTFPLASLRWKFLMSCLLKVDKFVCKSPSVDIHKSREPWHFTEPYLMAWEGKLSELFCAILCAIILHSALHTRLNRPNSCLLVRFSFSVIILFVTVYLC